MQAFRLRLTYSSVILWHPSLEEIPQKTWGNAQNTLSKYLKALSVFALRHVKDYNQKTASTLLNIRESDNFINQCKHSLGFYSRFK
jgi:hypothetical protein